MNSWVIRSMECDLNDPVWLLGSGSRCSCHFGLWHLCDLIVQTIWRKYWQLVMILESLMLTALVKEIWTESDHWLSLIWQHCLTCMVSQTSDAKLNIVAEVSKFVFFSCSDFFYTFIIIIVIISVSGMQHLECIAPNIDINFQSSHVSCYI